ncbi:ATP-binding protein [Streptomyces sp. NPDC058701]|uniref:ATP-binding protein n=1 Tax=Streptomyces sp. NPDC058701 TaxID=3346608 RepID=UPI00364E03D7
MDKLAEGAGPHAPSVPSISATAVFEGIEPIATARDFARSFLLEVRDVHRIPVSDQAMGAVELVVSELITNTRKYAPGPGALALHIRDGCAEVTVSDGNPEAPVVLRPDPARVGRHGLEIVAAVSRSLQVHREPAGKRITAAIGLTDAPGSLLLAARHGDGDAQADHRETADAADGGEPAR